MIRKENLFEICFYNPFDHIYTSHPEFENFVNYVEGMIDSYYLKGLPKKNCKKVQIFKILPIIFLILKK
jgi:hypothetical protein